MWKPKTRRGEGRTAQRVADLLLDALNKQFPDVEGIGIAPTDFWFQKGDYVKMTWDLARWGADIPMPGTGLKITLHSWDTMKQCAKSGLELRHDIRDHNSMEFEVCANSDPI